MNMSLTLSSETCCPACANKTHIYLENIDLKLQHALYAPNDTLAQRNLTEEASLSADYYTMLQCNRCNLEFAQPLVAPSSVWYSHAYSLLALYPSARWEFDYAIAQLNITDLVGEIGCGSGNFLKKCQNQGIKCHGLDFSSTAIQACVANGLSASLLDIVNNELDETTKKSVVVSFHVLEHLENPHQLFNLAGKWSQENASLWVAVPSDHRPTRHLGETEFLDQPPHHLTRWNLSSLTSIGEANGWKLDSLIYEPISFSASIWYYSTRTAFYQFIRDKIKTKNSWLERMIRACVYPLAALQWLLNKKMTGYSMLARYSKYKITH
jgi:Methyltransferase domain